MKEASPVHCAARRMKRTLTAGRTPACWNNQVKRSAGRMARFHKFCAWAEKTARSHPRLDEQPLFGRCLADLTGEDRRRDQTETQTAAVDRAGDRWPWEPRLAGAGASTRSRAAHWARKGRLATNRLPHAPAGKTPCRCNLSPAGQPTGSGTGVSDHLTPTGQPRPAGPPGWSCCSTRPAVRYSSSQAAGAPCIPAAAAAPQPLPRSVVQPAGRPPQARPWPPQPIGLQPGRSFQIHSRWRGKQFRPTGCVARGSPGPTASSELLARLAGADAVDTLSIAEGARPGAAPRRPTTAHAPAVTRASPTLSSRQPAGKYAPPGTPGAASIAPPRVTGSEFTPLAPPGATVSFPALSPPQKPYDPTLPAAAATLQYGTRREVAETAPEDLEALASRIKRILDEEARRHGIDV